MKEKLLSIPRTESLRISELSAADTEKTDPELCVMKKKPDISYESEKNETE